MTVAEKLTTIAENVPKVFEAGKKDEYERFWDDFQQNGNKTNYRYAFFQWSDHNYNPKYPIKLSSQANDVFYYCKMTDTRVDISATTGLSRCFSQCTNLVTIRKLSVTENVSFSTDCFAKCSSLKNITFEGVIGSTIDFSASPLLTVESMKSIILCLKDYSGTDKEYANTVRFTQECWDALDISGPSPFQMSWVEYVSSIGWLS